MTPTAPFVHHRADYLGNGIRSMHLLRETECFECALAVWVTAVRFAFLTGDWKPAGTTAVYCRTPGAYGGEGDMAEGHYIPMSQTLHAEDAAALAVGIRQALRDMPRGQEFRDGGGIRYHRVRDERLHERRTLAGGVVPVWQLVVDTDMDDGDGERLADFLERGACTIEYGAPAYVRLAEELAQRRRERRAPFEREEQNLLAAMQAGVMTIEQVAPRLDAVRAQLARFDAEMEEWAASQAAGWGR